MTIQEKKGFLQGYQELNAEIRQIGVELREWRTRAVRMTVLYADLAKSGKVEKRTQTAMEQIAQLEERLDRQVEELVKVRVEIGKIIGRLDSPEMRRLLKYRYIAGYTWAKVADEMGYSTRHVMRMHDNALRRLPL